MSNPRDHARTQCLCDLTLEVTHCHFFSGSALFIMGGQGKVNECQEVKITGVTLEATARSRQYIDGYFTYLFIYFEV